jgi:SulP family sulfate permease
MILPTALAISRVGLMESFLSQDILRELTYGGINKDTKAKGQVLAYDLVGY